MTSKKTYIIRDLKLGRTKEVQFLNIQNLRQYLIQSKYPWGAQIVVFTKTGNILGEYHQGSYEGFWKTPAGKFYSLFRDGSFRGEY